MALLSFPYLLLTRMENLPMLYLDMIVCIAMKMELLISGLLLADMETGSAREGLHLKGRPINLPSTMVKIISTEEQSVLIRNSGLLIHLTDIL